MRIIFAPFNWVLPCFIYLIPCFLNKRYWHRCDEMMDLRHKIGCPYYRCKRYSASLKGIIKRLRKMLKIIHFHKNNNLTIAGNNMRYFLGMCSLSFQFFLLPTVLRREGQIYHSLHQIMLNTIWRA